MPLVEETPIYLYIYIYIYIYVFFFIIIRLLLSLPPFYESCKSFKAIHYSDVTLVKGCCLLFSQKPSELSRSKTFSTLSDILKRVNARASSSGQQRTDNPAPGVSKSTLELNLQHSDMASNARTTVRENEISHSYALSVPPVRIKDKHTVSIKRAIKTLMLPLIFLKYFMSLWMEHCYFEFIFMNQICGMFVVSYNLFFSKQ